MNARAISMSDLSKSYKEAKTKDEEFLAILDLVKESEQKSKKEILKEIKHDELATKADLANLKNVLLLDLAHTKNTLLYWMIGICGIWVPAIVAIVTKHIGA